MISLSMNINILEDLTGFDRYIFIPANNRGFEVIYKMLYGHSPFVVRK